MTWRLSMQKVKLIVALAIILLAVIWIVQNTGPVETRFLFVKVTMPQAALLAITFLVGGGAGILLALTLSGKWIKKGA